MLRRAEIAVCWALGFGLLAQAFAAAADEREPISLPPEVKERFMTEMRGHMGNLDDILAALAEGDFAEAANVAEIHMDFGHSMWSTMMEQGMSAEQILAAKKQMRAKGMGMGQGQGQGMGHGMGQGMGRFMTEDFRSMGATFHEAATAFATRARQAASPPTAADYKETTEVLQAVTSTCRACHDSFRVE
ncbi:MAG: cytochrome c [Rhodospirillaceae bacterium]|nr:cytochrome c [Rhodospirillaceae bacterium]